MFFGETLPRHFGLTFNSHDILCFVVYKLNVGCNEPCDCCAVFAAQITARHCNKNSAVLRKLAEIGRHMMRHFFCSKAIEGECDSKVIAIKILRGLP
jgi:hypothetical protein